jgi:hypothetical protein
MPFNWKKYEAWRKHPFLKVKPTSAVPGLGLGLGLFGIYMVGETLANMGSKDDKGHH